MHEKTSADPGLFGPLERELPPGPPVTFIPVAAFPAALAGPSPARKFVDSVAGVGVIVPVVVAEDAAGTVEFAGGRYSLIDGNRRVMAAREAGRESIPALVLPAGADPSLALTLNGLRAANPVTEFCAIKALLAEGHSKADIAKLTGFPPAKITKRLRLETLHADLFAALSEQRVSATVAEEAAKLPVGMQERLGARLVEQGRLSADNVREVRMVRREEAVAELPFEAFAPEAAASPAWRDGARLSILQLVDWIAEEAGADPAARAVIDRLLRAAEPLEPASEPAGSAHAA